jgi:HD-GYP domain-containing protein (c-di-GMP phosphodiesterase class II)
LKDYHSILTMENSKLSLQHIIQVTPHLYSLKLDCLEPFFRWVLAQLVYVFRLGRQESLLDLVGHLATIEGNEVKLQASIGVFDLDRKNPDLLQDLFQKCKKIALDQSHVQALDYGSIVLPIKTTKQTLGFAHFQCAEGFRGGDLESVQILVNQLAASLENLMLHHNLENSYNQSIDMLATVAEFKDQTIGGHINRIQELTKLLSIALGLSDEEVDIYTKASRLHDIGKVGIPDAVLCKPSRLTHDEFRLISQHTMFGEKILEKSPSLHTARIVARSHHEKWSGDGYPDGLYGKEIPLVARIVSIVDVFDALASPRPYKNAWNIDDVVGEIEAASGSQFDPIVVATFLRIYNSGDLDNLINEYKQFSLPPLD